MNGREAAKLTLLHSKRRKVDHKPTVSQRWHGACRDIVQEWQLERLAKHTHQDVLLVTSDLRRVEKTRAKVAAIEDLRLFGCRKGFSSSSSEIRMEEYALGRRPLEPVKLRLGADV